MAYRLCSRITGSAAGGGAMLKVDLRNLSRGGLTLAALAILASVVVMAVLAWAAPEGLLQGRPMILIAFGGLAAAWLVAAVRSMVLKRRGVPIVRPEAQQGPSPEEVAARLPQKLDEYRRLRRLLQWLLIGLVLSLVVFGAGLGLMQITGKRWPAGVVAAAMVPLLVLGVSLKVLQMHLSLWPCPWCGREFGFKGAFGSAPHKCKHCGHAIDLT
jgi:hypothetical protein